jgi:hypothetical protein
VGKRFDDLRQHPTDLVRVGRHVGIEESLYDNLQSQPHHVAMNVPLLIRLPIRNRSLCEVHHHIAVRVDPLTMKSRLGKPTLALPFVVFAGQQSITDEALKKRGAECSRLDEILCVG